MLDDELAWDTQHEALCYRSWETSPPARSDGRLDNLARRLSNPSCLWKYGTGRQAGRQRG
jgi:hypothetical protein